MINGPIVLVEDDADDVDIFTEVLKELNIPNKLIHFENPREAYNFLSKVEEQPYIIICDVNLPGMSGMEFKNKLDANEWLKKKSIPFIFYSTSSDKKHVLEAYLELTVQGYFRKAQNFAEIKNQIRTIFEYWKICQHPNT